LHERRHREETGRFLVDGVRLVEEALRAAAPVEHLLVAADPENPRLAALLDEARGRGIPIVDVAPHVLAAVSEVETPQGVIAVVRRTPAALEPLLVRLDLLLLIVDRVQDPGNLGTMIRTADAAGASAVVLLPGTVDPLNPKVVRASMGSLFYLPVTEWPASGCGPRCTSGACGWWQRMPGGRWISATPTTAAHWRSPWAMRGRG